MQVKDSKDAVKAMKQTAPNAPDPTDMAEGSPNAGTRTPAGKSSDCDATLRKGNLPKSSAVTTAKEDVGAHKRAVEVQEGCNLSKLPKDTPPGGDKKEE